MARAPLFFSSAQVAKMKTLPVLAPCLLFAFTIACGDSSTGQGGDGAGNSPSNGGNGGNGNTGGSGGITSAGGNGSGGTPITEPCPTPVSDVPQDECDLYLQTCPNGDTCDIGDGPEKGFDPVAACFPQDGLKSISESCNESAECQAKLTCIGNRCSPFCCPSNPDSCGGGLCNVTVDLIGPPPESLPTGKSFQGCSFSPTCDLFTPDSCPETENCYLSGDAQTTCYQGVEPPVPNGEPCANLNDCIDSSACIGPDDNAFCYYLCLEDSVAAPGLGGCPGGQACDLNLTSGIAGLGYCH